ncbi:MAG: hypothetical protein LBB22_00505 [Treponema sp.]|jgi:hypothetical protein|nr:hypothetical protein [Treponema sp.]
MLYDNNILNTALISRNSAVCPKARRPYSCGQKEKPLAALFQDACTLISRRFDVR